MLIVIRQEKYAEKYFVEQKIQLFEKFAIGGKKYHQFFIIPVENLDFGKHIPDNRELSVLRQKRGIYG